MMAMKNPDKYVVKFHEPAEQQGKGDYLAIDVYRDDKLFGTLEVDDEGVDWIERTGSEDRVAGHKWDDFANLM